jgi:hypothetical protein
MTNASRPDTECGLAFKPHEFFDPKQGRTMSKGGEAAPETVDEPCRVMESTKEFVDEVDATDIARKLFEQIERLQEPS